MRIHDEIVIPRHQRTFLIEKCRAFFIRLPLRVVRQVKTVIPQEHREVDLIQAMHSNPPREIGGFFVERSVLFQHCSAAGIRGKRPLFLRIYTRPRLPCLLLRLSGLHFAGKSGIRPLHRFRILPIRQIPPQRQQDEYAAPRQQQRGQNQSSPSASFAACAAPMRRSRLLRHNTGAALSDGSFSLIRPERTAFPVHYGFRRFGPRKINMASLMVRPSSSMVSRSTPRPNPPCGGQPYLKNSR